MTTPAITYPPAVPRAAWLKARLTAARDRLNSQLRSLEGPNRRLRQFTVARWIVSVAVLLFAPKCLFCVAGYLGVATGFGFVSAELCGGTPDSLGLPLLSVVSMLGVSGLGLCALLLGRRFFRISVRHESGRSLNQ